MPRIGIAIGPIADKARGTQCQWRKAGTPVQQYDVMDFDCFIYNIVLFAGVFLLLSFIYNKCM